MKTDKKHEKKAEDEDFDRLCDKFFGVSEESLSEISGIDEFLDFIGYEE